MHIELKS